MPKNIVLLFDGTWNRPSDAQDPEASTDTNVLRFHRAVRSRSATGDEQVAWYDEGVGTEWMNKVRGGAFGSGLDKHITDGYAKLCELYQDGDRIYLLGFSRGAYTARSLVGMVRNAGLLRHASSKLIDEAYGMYRARNDGPESDRARAFRAEHSREIEIEFVGVWDTVGALGIPLKAFKEFNAAKYSFHDTRLSRIVHNAFHAVALDEHRRPYAATLWGPKSVVSGGQRIEQVWFPGAHADVGGGYATQPLSNPPLRWMQRRAIECGLTVDVLPEPNDEEIAKQEYLAPEHDSFGEFLGGGWAMLNRRYYRPVGKDGDGPQALHRALLRRLDESESYRPRNPGVAAQIVRNNVADN